MSNTDLLGDPISETPPMDAPLPWRVYQMNDHPEYWVARTLDEAKACVAIEWGDSNPELVEDAFELSDESLDSERLDIADHDDPEVAPVMSTFREELNRRIAAGLSAPEFFAAAE